MSFAFDARSSGDVAPTERTMGHVQAASLSIQDTLITGAGQLVKNIGRWRSSNYAYNILMYVNVKKCPIALDEQGLRMQSCSLRFVTEYIDTVVKGCTKRTTCNGGDGCAIRLNFVRVSPISELRVCLSSYLFS
jgi:hypothetical protein